MDRLQEIKERHNSSINSFVDGDDIDWLIEKLEYLQKYNLYSDFVNKIDELIKENDELNKEIDYLREANSINGLVNTSMNEKIKQYEDVIGAIANIDGAFITPEGDCDYTDKQALEKIAEWVDPIWSDIAKRERRL